MAEESSSVSYDSINLGNWKNEPISRFLRDNLLPALPMALNNQSKTAVSINICTDKIVTKIYLENIMKQYLRQLNATSNWEIVNITRARRYNEYRIILNRKTATTTCNYCERDIKYNEAVMLKLPSGLSVVACPECADQIKKELLNVQQQ